MPIKIAPRGDLYTAEVTPPHGSWRSSHPVRSDELARALIAIGCRPLDIAQALREAGVQSYSGYYREVAEEAARRVRAVRSGELELPMQPPFTEAWLALAIFLGESPQSLEEIIDGADYIWHAVPDPDQVAWAFLQLKRRGWLLEQGTSYGLTGEARRTIEGIVRKGEGGVLAGVERLKEWVSAHPPPGSE